VGGDHYKKQVKETWDLWLEAGLCVWSGNITRYIARRRRSTRIEDLRKALHYCEKVREAMTRGHVFRANPLSQPESFQRMEAVENFVRLNGLKHLEAQAIFAIVRWEMSGAFEHVIQCGGYVSALIDEELDAA
jgi:hypothetical protein